MIEPTKAQLAEARERCQPFPTVATLLQYASGYITGLFVMLAEAVEAQDLSVRIGSTSTRSLIARLIGEGRAMVQAVEERRNALLRGVE